MDIDLVNGSEIFNQSIERDPFGRLILPSRVTPMSPTSDSGQISPLPERISSPSPVTSPVAQRSVSRPPLQVTRALTPVTRTDRAPSAAPSSPVRQLRPSSSRRLINTQKNSAGRGKAGIYNPAALRTKNRMEKLSSDDSSSVTICDQWKKWTEAHQLKVKKDIARYNRQGTSNIVCTTCK